MAMRFSGRIRQKGEEGGSQCHLRLETAGSGA